MSTARVDFTRGAAERIARVVRLVEQGERDQTGPRYGRAVDTPGGVINFRVATFSNAWSIGSNQTVTFYNQTATPNTVSATNLFFDYPTPGGTVHCGIAREGTAWYLIDVPIEYGTAVGLQSFSTVNAVVITGTIQTAGFVIGVSAVLDTVTCDIDVTLQSSSINYWGPTNTTSVTLITAASTSTQAIQYLRFAD